ncbi:hypothetical protein FHS31_000792 [Sphingomonas vulcanisoli]|uniref:Uncharacterized protein n=1 Tax=Sphingomonas vulcanisoli TaxID=1658060 RepID=A0ABX0TUE3_9SPHN|nr:hypothetical protein [Sphingomonas vulcanisoli]NIJ07196.1 hypothetical protein [Sphingomonas vulcanisoli]
MSRAIDPDWAGRRVRFTLRSRLGGAREIEAKVLRHRTNCYAGGGQSDRGWLDTIDDTGIERSARVTQVTVIA